MSETSIPKFSDFEHYGELALEEWAAALVEALKEAIKENELLRAELDERA